MSINGKFQHHQISLWAVSAMLILTAFSASAEEVAAETSEAGGMDDAQASAVAMERDPFWPVGFKPKRNMQTETAAQDSTMMIIDEETDWSKAMQHISIQGVSSRAGNEFYAIINGQVKSTGETVTVKVGSVNYTWMIESISPPNSVKLRRVSAQ